MTSERPAPRCSLVQKKSNNYILNYCNDCPRTGLNPTLHPMEVRGCLKLFSSCKKWHEKGQPEGVPQFNKKSNEFTFNYCNDFSQTGLNPTLYPIEARGCLKVCSSCNMWPRKDQPQGVSHFNKKSNEITFNYCNDCPRTGLNPTLHPMEARGCLKLFSSFKKWPQKDQPQGVPQFNKKSNEFTFNLCNDCPQTGLNPSLHPM